MAVAFQRFLSLNAPPQGPPFVYCVGLLSDAQAAAIQFPRTAFWVFDPTPAAAESRKTGRPPQALSPNAPAWYAPVPEYSEAYAYAPQPYDPQFYEHYEQYQHEMFGYGHGYEYYGAYDYQSYPSYPPYYHQYQYPGFAQYYAQASYYAPPQPQTPIQPPAQQPAQPQSQPQPLALRPEWVPEDWVGTAVATNVMHFSIDLESLLATLRAKTGATPSPPSLLCLDLRQLGSAAKPLLTDLYYFFRPVQTYALFRYEKPPEFQDEDAPNVWGAFSVKSHADHLEVALIFDGRWQDLQRGDVVGIPSQSLVGTVHAFDGSNVHVLVGNRNARPLVLQKDLVQFIDRPVALERHLSSDRGIPYRTRRGETRTAVHCGQVKLLLSEIEFLTQHCTGPDCLVLYAGAAPGIHIPYLASLFPHAKFELVDPAPFQIEPNKNISAIRRELFTDEVALEYAARRAQGDYKKLLFISDVRRGGPRGMTSGQMAERLQQMIRKTGRSGDEEFEEGVKDDMDAQMKWHQLLDTDASIFKFRLPWNTCGVTRYLDGQILRPVFGPIGTTESRMVCLRGCGLRWYDNTKYEAAMFHHNTVCREQNFYTHTVHDADLDYHHDGASAIHVLLCYLRAHPQYLKDKGVPREKQRGAKEQDSIDKDLPPDEESRRASLMLQEVLSAGRQKSFEDRRKWRVDRKYFSAKSFGYLENELEVQARTTAQREKDIVRGRMLSTCRPTAQYELRNMEAEEAAFEALVERCRRRDEEMVLRDNRWQNRLEGYCHKRNDRQQIRDETSSEDLSPVKATQDEDGSV
eukprot:TRINITY_DN1254_c0_g1_i4.p2 TRINITY_DN1254_c0_g1~~TRINITY_DN1254_c0_g1_i4.p2  ORF type:complete len:801 (+),score=102.49 TRINITY_DN1254_c0_g1_i4:5033-7435(+)